ncbi:aldehyde reductase [Nitrospirillum sp. BR 11163]|uniref:SDR family oxidoreductase n=1 Tax=Nitrospirillum sp. BR 11163 TaxID=3104323 RepID=UPI002AFDDB6D|nr:aldehyde reductase [Nitrospirillum sp. BR 11163]MEA1676516.1 aldehyde reductase [Nitrospirillum sp. BR 11163]
MGVVLVTGGSGFVASHVILKLLSDGHEVRTTVRSGSRERLVREMLRNGGQEPDDQLRFFEADLTRDEGWATAVADCDYVLHVASPFPSGVPKDENELIVPARDGTLRVLRAARDAGVRRVVMTSSFAAVGYGRQHRAGAYTEEDWTEPDAPNPPYIKSKAIAERTAWDFMDREGGALELSVINPVGIFGPALGRDYSSSIALIKAMLDGAMPGLPDVYFGVVDVRDVADLHLRAMTHPQAAGQRFIGVAGPSLALADVADILRARLGPAASRVPTRKLPSWKVRLLAPFSKQARATVPNLGKQRQSSNAKARQMLGWSPRSSEEAILASARSLIDLQEASK